VLADRRFTAVVLVFGVLLMVTSIGGGFQLDDHYQRFRLLGLGDPAIDLFIFFDGDEARNAQAMEVGAVPWWTTPDLRHANFRYLSVLSMQLDYWLWPDQPERMHLHSLAWLAALIAAAALLFRQIFGATWAAGLALLMYGIDEAHALPVAYLANRGAVIATCFGILCIWSFARWRDDQWRPGSILTPLFLALALSAGEIALATAGYLFSYSVFIDRDTITRRIRAWIPCGIVLLLWAAIYKLGGYGAAGSGFYLDPLGDTIAFLEALTHRVPVLLLGQWTPIPADFVLASSLDAAGRSAMVVAGVVTATCIALVLIPVLRTNRSARFWALGSLLALLPIAGTGPQNRLLFFVGLGSFALIAQLLEALLGDSEASPINRWWRGSAWITASLLLLFHLALAPFLIAPTVAFHDRSAAALRVLFDSVPDEDSLSEQTLIIVNPPNYTYGVGAIQPTQISANRGAPARVRSLSAGGTPAHVTRIDDHTLRVDLEAGLFPNTFSRYYRSKKVGFSPGWSIALSDVEIEIEQVDQAGDPKQLLFRFRQRLEDHSLRWLVWENGEYRGWTPPAIGESQMIPAAASIFSQ
jgi:hypothetical protein